MGDISSGSNETPVRNLYGEVAELRHGLATAARLLQPRLGSVPSVNLAFWMQPAGVLGGDFVDLVHLDHGRVALVMGDAVGSGPMAWAAAAATKFYLRMALWNASTVEDAMGLANRAMCYESQSDAFVAALVAAIDPIGRTVEIVSAGYPQPLRVSATDRAVLTGPVNMPLGIAPACAFSAYRVRMDETDCLVFFSDGVSEQRNARGEAFGAHQILTAAEPAADKTVTAVRAAVQAFGGAEFADDVTLVALDTHARTRPALAIHFPPDIERIGTVRKAIEAAARRAGLQDEALAAFVTAVGEALGNAVLHGSVPGADNTVEASFWEEPAAVAALVKSRRTNWTVPESAAGGRGLVLMRALADEVQITQSASATSVLLRKHRPAQDHLPGELT